MDHRQIDAREKPKNVPPEIELAWALQQVLSCKLPNGTVMDAYLPSELRQDAVNAMVRFLEEYND